MVEVWGRSAGGTRTNPKFEARSKSEIHMRPVAAANMRFRFLGTAYGRNSRTRRLVRGGGLHFQQRIHSRKRSWHDGASRRGTRSKSDGRTRLPAVFSEFDARGKRRKCERWDAVLRLSHFSTYCGVSTNSQRMPCPVPSPRNRSRWRFWLRFSELMVSCKRRLGS